MADAARDLADEAHANENARAPSLKRQGLYPCEAEIARRLSQSAARWRTLAPALEKQGLPRIDTLMGARYWPAVQAFFHRRHGIGNIAPPEPDGEEHWDD